MIVAKFLVAFMLMLISTALAKPQIAPRQNNRGQVVFLGDSITDFWRQNGWQPWAEFYEPLGAVNTGVAGDLTTNTIQRITNDGIIDNLNSRLAVLLIGTNDLAWGGLNEAQVHTNIGTILNLIREKNPGCKILLLGVLPRIEPDIHQKIQNLNALIPQHAEAEDVFFLDMGDQFATGLGQIIGNLYSDGIHLTPDGYNVWSRTMNPLFFEILDGTPQPTTLPPVPTTPNPNRGKVVFLGDSITDFWRNEGLQTWNLHYEPLGAVNTGVAGDLTSNTISRISNDGIIDNLNSELAVLKIGTNDLSWGVSDQEIITNIGTIINLIRQKNTGVKILLLGILPRAPAEIHLRARTVNAQIASYADADDVFFLDMNDAFSYDVGMVYPELYWDDYLHINAAGYAKWAETMNPTFFAILNGENPPTNPPTTTRGPTTENPNGGQVVFLGDQITDQWRDFGQQSWDLHYGPVGAENLGVSGDLTTHTIQRITFEGLIDNFKPKLAVLTIGTNDLSWGVSDEDIVHNIDLILTLIREKSPGVKILLLGILPRAPAEIHVRAQIVNAKISSFATAPDVYFLDMNDDFSDVPGMVFPELYQLDYIHLNSAGYAKWAEIMNPIFFEILNSLKRQ